MRLSSLLLLSLTLITQYIKSNELYDLNNVAKNPNSNYNPSNIEFIEQNLEKSTLDSSEYRVIKLQNGIEVALVSDPSIQLAATSVAVRVGSKDDPKDFPGLAHLCEHLFFMGTEKYPKESEYASFVLNHGGSFDSYTTLERTVFITEINPKYHYEQLDRMANFFIKPLFKEETLERETHAVNSEFQRYRSTFSKAKLHLLSYVLRDTGFFPEFAAGNRQTLFSNPRAKNMDIKNALNDFFNKFYHSRDMKVAVYGNESLDALQEQVQKTFGQIQDKNERALDDIDPFKAMDKYHYWYAFPEAPYVLDIVFLVPSTRLHYKSIPLHYLNYIFSYPGPNSPLQYLGSKRMASRIEFSNVPYSSKYDLLYVSLTPLYVGRLLTGDLIVEFFKCLKFFQETGPNKEVFEEIMRIQKNNFDYSFKESASELVEKLSTSMLSDSLPRKYLLKQDVVKEYDEKEIKEFFSALNRDNFISFANTQKKFFNETDPYYKISYLKEFNKEEFIGLIKNATSVSLAYPSKNIYVSTDLQITMEKLNQPLTKPDLLKDTSASTLWHKHASFFYCPYGIVRILLRNPYVSASPSNILRTGFLQLYIYNSIPFDLFLLSMANINFYVAPSSQGLVITFHGYTDKMTELVSQVITVLKQASLVERQFDLLKSDLIKNYVQNILLEPSAFLEADIDNLLLSERQPTRYMLYILDQFQHFEINAFFYDLLANLHFDVLVTGNIPQEDALHIVNMLEVQLASYPLTPSQYTNQRAITLENGSDYFYVQPVPNNEKKSALLVYFEVADVKDSRKVQLLYLLYLILREPMFNQLRTKEQLGSSLKTYVKVSGTILGYYFVIQSERQPHVLHSRVDVFLNEMLDRLRDITPEEFGYYLEGYNTVFHPKHPNIVFETSHIWSSIVDGTYAFDSDKFEEDISSIKLQDVIELFEEIIYSKRRRISYFAFSQVATDIYNVFDLPLDKLSDYLATKGDVVSKDELYEYVLLSHDFESFLTNLSKRLSNKYKDKTALKLAVDETVQFLKDLYLSEKAEIIKPLNYIDNLVYFKANSTLSPAYIRTSLWNKFY